MSKKSKGIEKVEPGPPPTDHRKSDHLLGQTDNFFDDSEAFDMAVDDLLM